MYHIIKKLTKKMESIRKKIIVAIMILIVLYTLPTSKLYGQLPPYKNPKLKIEERVNDLIGRMTIEEKVNQMLKLSLENLKPDNDGNIPEESLKELFKGESIGCLDPPRWNKVEDKPIDVKGIAKYSEAADKYLRENTRLGIPAIQVDLGGIHGQLAYDATIFPQTIGQGSTWNPELIKEMATLLAYEASLTGCDQFFAPLFDLARDPRYGRVEECFGEDSYHVAEMGKAFIIGMQGDPIITRERIPKNHIMSTAKHYVGYSTPIAGINIAPIQGRSARFQRSSFISF